MKAVVVIFPGSNREHDVCMALKRATGHEPEILDFGTDAEAG